MTTLQPGKWSCFVLHEDKYWEQPTYRISREMTEEEFIARVLKDWDRHFFAVCGVGEDEA